MAIDTDTFRTAIQIDTRNPPRPALPKTQRNRLQPRLFPLLWATPAHSRHSKVLLPTAQRLLPILLISVIASGFVFLAATALAQGQTDIAAPLSKYSLGKTAEAIGDFEQLLGSLNYDSDKVSFIRTARILLDLYWRVEDADGIHNVLRRADDVLKDRQPLDDADRFLLAHRESYRIRELMLSGHLAAARESGVKILQVLQTPSAIAFRPARFEVLLTLAMISRAEFRLAEAESYMHQAMGLALTDKQFVGVPTLEFLQELLRHYMETGQYQYAVLIAQRLGKNPAVFTNISDRSIQGFSLGLLLAEIALQTQTIESSEALRQLLLGLERTEPTIQRLPRRLRTLLYAMILYFGVQHSEIDRATRAFGLLEALYQEDDTRPRALANVLAWGAFRFGAREAVTRYLKAGDSQSDEINVYLYPLNRLVAAHRHRDGGRLLDAARDAQESIWALLKNIAARSFAAPTTTINLSFIEQTLVVDFLRLALDLSPSMSTPHMFDEQLSLVIQLLQRDRIPRGALFTPGLMVAPNANVEEHLRAREHLAQARYREVLTVVDLLVERAAMTTVGPSPKVYEYGEMNRFFEYTFRINELDKYLQTVLYNQKDFIASRLALIAPDAIQRVLLPEEAIVSHVAMPPDKLVIECLTRDSVSFTTALLDIKKFVADVRLLNLSVSATHGLSQSLDGQYPAASAVAVYETLFAPAATCLAGKTRLIIATEPALLGVPFNALLTAMPTPSDDGYDLRHAPWMIREWALSVSLARSTLLYQRSRPTILRPRRPIIGFGNPVFDGTTTTGRVVDPRAFYSARGGARIEALRGLPALPDSEAEVRRISSYLGGSDAALFFGQEATERNVRSQNLDDYRVVVFATHGLTAGEFDSLAEPALALTPVDAQDTRNDGLLRMSEISRLWIPADLVVLSACNTAAGDGTPSAAGFSGLVNAFFFAGARAVLASQWPVASEMAEALTTGMFGAVVAQPDLPPSAALQHAMLQVIEQSPERAYAHPRFWAPFLVVGDGARAHTAAFDSSSAPTKPQLATLWERNFGEKLAGEILAVDADNDGAVYAMGYTEPENDRAKSLIVALDRNGTEHWRVEDPKIAAGTHLLRYAPKRLVADGYLGGGEEPYEAVILRAFDTRNGAELWRAVIDTPEHEKTLGLLESSGGRLLWIVGSYPDVKQSHEGRLTVRLVSIDFAGNIITSLSQEWKGDAFRFFWGTAVVRWAGQLLLAWSTTETVSDAGEMFGEGSRDSPSGYSTACATKRRTRLLLINESAGVVVADKTLEDVHIKSFVVVPGGRLLASADVWPKCLGNSDVAVVEMAEDLSIRTVFRYGGPLEKVAGDITRLPDGRIVLAGRLSLLFDLDPYVKRDPSDLSWLLRGWTGEFFASDRQTFSAFVVVLDNHGTFVVDRVIRDLRGRVIRSVTARDDGSIVFGGLANGVSNWLGVIDPN